MTNKRPGCDVTANQKLPIMAFCDHRSLEPYEVPGLDDDQSLTSHEGHFLQELDVDGGLYSQF